LGGKAQGKLKLSGNGNECKPLLLGVVSAEAGAGSSGSGSGGGGGGGGGGSSSRVKLNRLAKTAQLPNGRASQTLLAATSNHSPSFRFNGILRV